MREFRIEVDLDVPRSVLWKLRGTQTFMQYLVERGALARMTATPIITPKGAVRDSVKQRTFLYVPKTIIIPDVVKSVFSDDYLELGDLCTWDEKDGLDENGDELPSGNSDYDSVKSAPAESASPAASDVSEEGSTPGKSTGGWLGSENSADTNTKTGPNNSGGLWGFFSSPATSGDAGRSTDNHSTTVEKSIRGAGRSYAQTFTITPGVLAEFISTNGQLTVDSHPSGDEMRCVHILSGTCNVSIPFVGGYVEDAIVTNMDTFYADYPEHIANMVSGILLGSQDAIGTIAEGITDPKDATEEMLLAVAQNIVDRESKADVQKQKDAAIETVRSEDA